jgi:tryptophan-rich sensory protein
MRTIHYYIIAIVLGVLWSILFFAFNPGVYIHLLLIFAVISLIFSVIQDDNKLIKKSNTIDNL